MVGAGFKTAPTIEFIETKKEVDLIDRPLSLITIEI
jgi:hypothetical protein